MSRNSLPKGQLAIVYAIQIAEPLSGTVIYPFLPEFVRRTGITGGDEAMTGYYSGIIVDITVLRLHIGTRLISFRDLCFFSLNVLACFTGAERQTCTDAGQFFC